MRLFGRFHKRTWQDCVSAYVDGELDAADRAWFEAQLANTPEARAAVDAERELRALLALTLPEVTAPRSFALTPEMAAANRPVPQAPVAAQARGFSKFAGAVSVVAAFAFFVVFAADATSTPDGDDSGSPASSSAELSPLADDTGPANSTGGAGSDPTSGSESLQYDDDGAYVEPTPAPALTGDPTAAGATTEGATPNTESATGPSDTDTLRQGTDDAAGSSAAPPAGDAAQLALEADDDRTTGGLGAVKVGLAIVAVAAAAAFVFTRRIGSRDA